MAKGTGIKIAGAVLGAGVLALAGVLGFGALGQNPPPPASSGSEPQNPPVLTRLDTPKNTADIYDTLNYAFGKSGDAVAWLDIPGTEVNGLVMQGDDNRYYERRDEDGNSNAYGCFFADYECGLGARENFSQNTVIYGHSELTDDPNGKRFAQMYRFTDLEFAKKTPYVYLTTPEGRYVFEIFSVCYTDVSFDYIQVNIDNEQKLAIAKKARELSIYDYGIEPQAENRLLTLSTCSVKNGNDGSQRFVVMGRLCPEGFTEKKEIPIQLKKP